MPVDVRITLRLPMAVHTALKREMNELKRKGADISLNQLIVDRLNAAAGNPYRGGEEASVADRVDTLESDAADLEKRLSIAENALVPNFTLSQRIEALEAEVKELKAGKR
jgi:hypothetical protein